MDQNGNCTHGLRPVKAGFVVRGGRRRLVKLCNLIREAEEEFVQSVDIDWEATVPVMGVQNVLKFAMKAPAGQWNKPICEISSI